MACCALEIPACKRNIMTSDKNYKKKECPLNQKMKCLLSPPCCPLLPQKTNKCGYAKLMGENVDITRCPCKSCFLNTGCPIAPVCLRNPFNKSQESIESNSENKLKKPPKTDGEIINPDNKITMKIQNFQNVPKCLSSSPRPLPCAECVLQELSSVGKKDNACPYLALPDICDEKCHCSEVPSIDTGPSCPFLPKPCPCCAKPRCPLTRKPDCVLNPKPLCCLSSPKCCCGSCTPMPECSPCSCNACSLCLPTCKTLSLLNSFSEEVSLNFQIPSSCPCPKIANNCLISDTLPNISNLKSSQSLPLGATAYSPPLTSCPLLSNCNCNISSLCSSDNKPCPLLNLCCSNPSCFPCLLKTVECILGTCSCSSKCSPIPPPCSLPTQIDSDSLKNKEKEDERSFHLPICPIYKPPCEMHNLLGNKTATCPFSTYSHTGPLNCPFPVSFTLFENENDAKKNIKEDNITMNQRNYLLSKQMKLSKQGSSVSNEVHKSKPTVSQSEVGRKMVLDSVCPYPSACGVIPSPECPAAEILCPDLYNKPEKVEKKTCPIQKCMTNEDCILGKAKPKVDCPLSKVFNCPMTKEQECPLEDLVNCPLLSQCSCSCRCLAPNRPISSEDFPATDGCLAFANKKINISPKQTSESTSTFECSSLPFSNFEHSLFDSADTNSDDITQSTALKSYLSTNTLLKFDGHTLVDLKTNSANSFTANNSSSECPFEPLIPKRICPLAPPKCPLTPKSACPLSRMPEPCPLMMGGELNCPVKYPPCKKFTKGRCPMTDINICDCDYPVSPCLLPLQDSKVIAPPQYCFRENCCMGLPFPTPVNKTAECQYEEGPFYNFTDTKPGKDETKHFVEVLKSPRNVEISLFGRPKKRLHNNWTVVKNGDGYLRCKTIAKKLKEIGPFGQEGTQYEPEDCPLDEETRVILENRKKHIIEKRELDNLKKSLGYTLHPEKRKKKETKEIKK